MIVLSLFSAWDVVKLSLSIAPVVLAHIAGSSKTNWKLSKSAAFIPKKGKAVREDVCSRLCFIAG